MGPGSLFAPCVVPSVIFSRKRRQSTSDDEDHRPTKVARASHTKHRASAAAAAAAEPEMTTAWSGSDADAPLGAPLGFRRDQKGRLVPFIKDHLNGTIRPRRMMDDLYDRKLRDTTTPGEDELSGTMRARRMLDDLCDRELEEDTTQEEEDEPKPPVAQYPEVSSPWLGSDADAPLGAFLGMRRDHQGRLVPFIKDHLNGTVRPRRMLDDMFNNMPRDKLERLRSQQR
ncbi:hypothetical protein F4778DRAFT_538624 [Xylariomycetidae sp. FL2044]|nr:hypothetical protein F4778DRAFT_538624 [Xylariomycetidae sp. FL2044]